MIVILGAGINGCALARELLLNGVSVTLVDTADVACGATAYSSRLIHGGLRYLEYGEFDLVRESLHERMRLLKLAPQFVRPLELAIPLQRLGGGLAPAAANLLGQRLPFVGKSKGHDRGLMLVWAGLMLYDAYARDPTLPRHRIRRVASDRMPVDARRFRWLAVYHDAQVRYPERFTLALLEDARRIAAQGHARFRFLNYHRARLTDGKIAIEPLELGPESGRRTESGARKESGSRRASGPSPASGSPPGSRSASAMHASSTHASPALEVSPAALINATGAWVDRTWQALDAPAPRLMGGTKGSHCFTFHAGLRDALAGRGIYAEAADGRPVFILPLGDTTLIGATDEPFAADPATAVAREDEVQYLLDAVNAIFPSVGLRRADIAFSYCGVRPLPYVGATNPAAITRRHSIQRRDIGSLPCYSIVGGKLTTCRSLAEEAAAQILKDLGQRPTTNSRERPLPGGENYPADEVELTRARQSLAELHHLPLEAVHAVWDLFGSRAGEILRDAFDAASDLGAGAARALSPGVAHGPAAGAARDGGAGAVSDAAARADIAPREFVPGTSLPDAVARWIIEHEWVATLDDLVERRLMLLYDRRLSRRTLERLAQLMIDAGRLAADAAPSAVEATARRLNEHFGKRLDD